MIDLLLSPWDEPLNSMYGRDMSTWCVIWKLTGFEQVLESEKKFLSLRFPTKYSNFLHGIKN